MKFHLRVDKHEPPDVYFSLLANGRYCGHSRVTFDEYSALGRSLLIGARDIEPPTSVSVDIVAFPTRHQGVGYSIGEPATEEA